MEDFYKKYIEQLGENYRSLCTIEKNIENKSFIKGKWLLNFCSNDYLGLSSNLFLSERAKEFASNWGVGATSSRLICGNFEIFDHIEQKIAIAKKTESALILNSGFQANTTIISSLLDKKILHAEPLVFSDRLNHSSIHEGCILAGIKQIRYKHLDLVHLENLLKKYENTKRPKFIITESIFSMDGDCVDLEALIYLKEKYNAFLYLDEAHSTGVLGKNGFGLSSDFPEKIDITIGTFGKALGSFGAYVACSKILRTFLINKCKGFIYSTPLPPMILGSIDAAIDIIPKMKTEREHLYKISNKFRNGLKDMGFNTGESTTQIIPLIIGDEKHTLEISKYLEKNGILALAIRYPTVPKGMSRIRFSLNAKHTDEEIEKALSVLKKIP